MGSLDDIWFVRHGQSAANAGLATDHPSSIPLTELGRSQAQAFADNLTVEPQWIAVSPFQRTSETAFPTVCKFPNVPVHVWPIQELTYLSPVRCKGTKASERQVWAKEYWERLDPLYIDGEGAESYAQFVQRLEHFEQLLRTTRGFGIVFGHGMFLKGFLVAREHKFDISPENMLRFRTVESQSPLKNVEITPFSRLLLP